MKIYNEIVIDMNPESSSYGETLYEDSFEHSGEMMLCRNAWQDSGWTYTDTAGVVWSSNLFINTWGNVGEQKIFKNGVEIYSYDKAVDRSEAKVRFDNYASHEGGGDKASGQIGGVTYTEGKFDPTSDEFRELVEKGGGGEDAGYFELAKGYGWGLGDFDEFNRAPLDYIEAQYGEGGTQQRRATLALEESKEDYASGMGTLVSQTGSNLADIYGQAEEAKRVSGFESMGSIDYTSKKAEKGVFQDYKMQQKDLARAKTSARSIFDISEQERGDTLTAEIEDFWETTREDFYTDLEENYGAT